MNDLLALSIPLASSQQWKRARTTAVLLPTAAGIALLILLGPLYLDVGLVPAMVAGHFAIVFIVGFYAYMQFRRVTGYVLDLQIDGFSLMKNGRCCRQAKWNEVRGYIFLGPRTGMRLLLDCQDHWDLPVFPSSDIPNIDTLVLIADSLDRHLPADATRTRGKNKLNDLDALVLAHGENLPLTVLQPGRVYRYLEASLLDRSAKHETNGIFYFTGSMVLTILSLCINGRHEPVFAACFVLFFLVMTVGIVVKKRSRNRAWTRFRQTVRGNIQAVEGGVKFPGDPRTYRPANEKTGPTTKVGDSFEIYSCKGDSVYVARQYLILADRPLTSMAQGSSPRYLSDSQPIEVQHE